MAALPTITFITGPRKSGKTTLASALKRQLRHPVWFDENGESCHVLGALPLELVPKIMRRAEDTPQGGYDNVIVSAEDHTALALVLAQYPAAALNVRVIRCEHPRNV